MMAWLAVWAGPIGVVWGSALAGFVAGCAWNGRLRT